MLLHKLGHEYVKRIQNCNALYWTTKARYKTKHKKNNRSSVFTLIYFPDVGMAVFPDFRIYLTNYSIKLAYMYIIRTDSMRRLKLCALFVVSTYISRVINENVCKMAKKKTLNFKFMRQMIYHLVG